jgi:hypothetical protein
MHLAWMTANLMRAEKLPTFTTLCPGAAAQEGPRKRKRRVSDIIAEAKADGTFVAYKP